MKATELLKKQHREVKALFGKAKKAKSAIVGTSWTKSRRSCRRT